MQRKLLVGFFPALLVSGLLISHPVFAESTQANATASPPPAKVMSVKSLATKQAKLSENLTLLDAKLADKAASTTDKDVMDQATLVHKASEEAKQAADDLDQAAKLSKSKRS